MESYTEFLERAPGEEPGWKTTTPELQTFVLDMRRSRSYQGIRDRDVNAFLEMGKAHGLRCEVLLSCCDPYLDVSDGA